jgi:hypothetical protein
VEFRILRSSGVAGSACAVPRVRGRRFAGFSEIAQSTVFVIRYLKVLCLLKYVSNQARLNVIIVLALPIGTSAIELTPNLPAGDLKRMTRTPAG